MQGAFAALKKQFGISADNVRKKMGLPAHTQRKTGNARGVMDKSVAGEMNLPVPSRETSSVNGQFQKEVGKQTLAVSSPEKLPEPATTETSADGDSSEIDEQAGNLNLAKFDAELLEGDIIGADLIGMKDAMQMILGQGGHQRLQAALKALGNCGYDSVSVESWLAGRTGPPVREKQAGKDEKKMQKASIHPWGHSQTQEERTDADVSTIVSYMKHDDRAALKQVQNKLLASADGQERLVLAILKLEAIGYSQDTLIKAFEEPTKQDDAVAIARAILLQLSGSVTRKPPRSSQQQFLSSER